MNMIKKIKKNKVAMIINKICIWMKMMKYSNKILEIVTKIVIFLKNKIIIKLEKQI